MTDTTCEMWDEVMRAERERLLAQGAPAPPRPVGPQTIHHTELPEDTSGGPAATEWNVYRREVGRLLAEGHEGRWVVIKGEQIVGIWDTEGEARAAAEAHPQPPVVIRRVLTREPVLRTPTFLYRCRN